MATRYFKKKDKLHICSRSSGNQSKTIPGLPHNSFEWIEIERNEFYRLKRKILTDKKLFVIMDDPFVDLPDDEARKNIEEIFGKVIGGRNASV